jgi:hypothetical protein
MIEYIAEGKVSSVRHLKAQTLITLAIPTARKAGVREVICRVRGKLSTRLKGRLQIGEWVVVRGEIPPPQNPVPADSIMRVSL